MEENWQIGDIAICIDNSSCITPGGRIPPLRLNYEYLVGEVRKCECGAISLDVGVLLINDSRGVECSCGACSSPKTGIHWCSSRRFTKKKVIIEKTTNEIEEEIKLAISNENYELADVLSQQLQKIK